MVDVINQRIGFFKGDYFDVFWLYIVENNVFIYVVFLGLVMFLMLLCFYFFVFCYFMLFKLIFQCCYYDVYVMINGMLDMNDVVYLVDNFNLVVEWMFKWIFFLDFVFGDFILIEQDFVIQFGMVCGIVCEVVCELCVLGIFEVWCGLGIYLFMVFVLMIWFSFVYWSVKQIIIDESGIRDFIGL